MSRQQALFADEGQAKNGELSVLMRKLGISEFPTYEVKAIPSQDVIVPGAETLARPHKLIKSIQQVGVLQAPAVVPCDPSGKYEVVLGRRRVLAVQFLNLPLVECKVYGKST